MNRAEDRWPERRPESWRPVPTFSIFPAVLRTYKNIAGLYTYRSHEHIYHSLLISLSCTENQTCTIITRADQLGTMPPKQLWFECYVLQCDGQNIDIYRYMCTSQSHRTVWSATIRKPMGRIRERV